MVTDSRRAREIAESVTDPELPVLTLADLGVLRAVELTGQDGVIVTITPTYSGCPALREMRADLHNRLRQAGFRDIEVRTVLDPPWTTDWISPNGKRKLAEYGIAPPGPAPRQGPVPLVLTPSRQQVRCPHCGAAETEQVSKFGATACKALRRCRACGEPFEHFKEF